MCLLIHRDADVLARVVSGRLMEAHLDGLPTLAKCSLKSEEMWLLAHVVDPGALLEYIDRMLLKKVNKEASPRNRRHCPEE